ncbi:hypothetical protein AAFF_G00063730 [Aldrovandia affinis]|uniref:Uncharacterized protein n=1 Tax=Aldrovandia affinis TaxID=143900 RepID=A0AAD7WYL3_9TELE|nr:hypothetical protein AAFF_G00063730 [Aldrovandia affinis]
MGARCVEEVTLTDLYYDTESFQLAAQQTWLSRQGAQWRLILDQGPRPSVDSLGLQAETGSGAPQAETDAGGEAGAEGSAESLRDSRFPKPAGLSEAPGGQNILPQSPPPAPRYRELTASSSIVEHLARRLQVELPAEEEGESMSVERFVELAGIHNYGSWTVSKRLEYRLPGLCTLEVRRDYSSALRAHTAVLTMGADVLDIGRELERMESLAAELDLQPRPA